MTDDTRPPARDESAEEFAMRLRLALRASTMESHRNVLVLIEQDRAHARAQALEEAARLSERYLPGSYVKQNAQAAAAVLAYRDGIRNLAAQEPGASTREQDGGE